MMKKLMLGLSLFFSVNLTLAAEAHLSKEELGKTLYFDPRLSVDGTVSCNSCHNVMAGGEDNRSFSMGVRGQRGGRSAPTVFNSAFEIWFFAKSTFSVANGAGTPGSDSRLL